MKNSAYISVHQEVAHRDFSTRTIKALRAKGVEIISSQAAPAFEGDKYFTGTVYTLTWNDTAFVRTDLQILAMAASSWQPSEQTI